MSNDRKDRVFLSYAREDLDTVRKVYDGLIKRDLNVWFDKEHLGLGKWKPQITRAITKSRYFVICISNAAIRKTGHEPGFQDEELNDAYEIAKNQPEKEFTIIPVRLEDCHRGDHRLTLFQQYDLFEDVEKGLDKLAVDMGGISLSDATAKDKRSEDEKLRDSLFSKAAADFFTGRYRESITFYDAILSLSADYAPAWHNKGLALLSLGRNEEAIEVCDNALKLDPNEAPAWVNKGAALIFLGRNEEAIEAFNKALKIDPNEAPAWVNKGAALIFLGRNEEALDAFNKALQIDPNDALTWFKKGSVLEEMGLCKEALAAISKALELNHDYASALELRNKVMNQLKDQN